MIISKRMAEYASHTSSQVVGCEWYQFPVDNATTKGPPRHLRYSPNPQSEGHLRELSCRGSKPSTSKRKGANIQAQMNHHTLPQQVDSCISLTFFFVIVASHITFGFTQPEISAFTLEN